jgi:hypothetical protein
MFNRFNPNPKTVRVRTVQPTVRTVSVSLIPRGRLDRFLRTGRQIKALNWRYNLTLGSPKSMQPFLRYGQNKCANTFQTVQTVSIPLIRQEWLDQFLRTQRQIKALNRRYNLTLGSLNSMQRSLRHRQNNLSPLCTV